MVDQRYFLQAIRPVLVGLILRDAACEDRVQYNWGPIFASQRQRAGQSERTHLPASIILVLCDTRMWHSHSISPRRYISKSYAVAPLAPGDRCTITGTPPPRKH